MLSNAFTYCFTSLSYYLPRRIPLRLMNYKDALTHPINDRLTKSKLIEISKSLQVECLANELTEPQLIPVQSYIKDVRARWDIHLTEWRAITKDIMKLGAMTREGWEYLYKMYWLHRLYQVMKIK